MVMRNLDKNATYSLSGENAISMSLSSYLISVHVMTFLVVVFKLNNYCTVYYCRLIYELCLYKCTHFFISTATL